MNIVVTGSAGFIGCHVAKKLLERDHRVYGIDNLSDYYDVNLKLARLDLLNGHDAFIFNRLDITDYQALRDLFGKHQINRVIHLAAQAGVRYSLKDPFAYIDANIKGFINILEACRHHRVDHLVYASTSSVYGANTNKPFSIHHNVDHPLSIYAATKKSNELMAHTYSHLYRLPTTGLRFFTVYGPWGRPDMSLFMFTKNIIENKPITVFNNGEHVRDFTYIDDIVAGIVGTCDRVATADDEWRSDAPDPGTSMAPYRLYNIGGNNPSRLMDYIHILEETLGKKAEINFLPMQPGDVPETWADVDDLEKAINYTPGTGIEVGIGRFVEWYKEFYRVGPGQ